MLVPLLIFSLSDMKGLETKSLLFFLCSRNRYGGRIEVKPTDLVSSEHCDQKQLEGRKD